MNHHDVFCKVIGLCLSALVPKMEITNLIHCEGSPPPDPTNNSAWRPLRLIVRYSHINMYMYPHIDRYMVMDISIHINMYMYIYPYINK